MTLTAPDRAATHPAPEQTLPPSIGAALREALDGPFHAIKQRWRTELSADEVTRDPSLGLAEARAWTLEALLNLTDKKFAIAGFPSEFGGQGTQGESVAHFEMLGVGDLSLTIKSGVQHGLFGGAVVNLGTRWHHETFLPDIVSCRLLGGFAMTERGHGSDVASLETTITWLPETAEFDVHSPSPSASKIYIGNAGADGRMMVVFGQLFVGEACEGVHAVLVPVRDQRGRDLPGVTTGDQGHKGGLLGVDNGTILFDHVRVPREMLLDRYGGVDESGVYHSDIESPSARFFTMLGTLVRGRVCVGGGAASAARRALSIATRYALQRSQFRASGLGDEITLMDYATHQRRLIPHIARAYANGFAQNELAIELQHVIDLNDAGTRDEKRARELETRAAGMKALLTHWAIDAIQQCREACGGAGFMSANQIVLSKADVDVFATFEGDNTVLLQLVAKALLLDHKRAWGELDLLGTAQQTARLMSGVVLERTAARALISRLVETAQRTPEAQLLTSRGWHVQMFEERERHIVEGLALRMRNASKAPKDEQFEATNRLQPHMLAAAKAHTERLVLEAFIEGIAECKDASAAAVLNQVCDLYALSSIEDDRAWFLEHHRLTPARSKAVSAAVESLCRQLRPHALALVEGLGVPESWLRAEMLG